MLISKNTEVLTSKGFKLISNLTENDKIIVINDDEKYEIIDDY